MCGKSLRVKGPMQCGRCGFRPRAQRETIRDADGNVTGLRYTVKIPKLPEDTEDPTPFR